MQPQVIETDNPFVKTENKWSMGAEWIKARFNVLQKNRKHHEEFIRKHFENNNGK